MPLGEMMQHAANHGVHHRGQVALLLRLLGHVPGDFRLQVVAGILQLHLEGRGAQKVAAVNDAKQCTQTFQHPFAVRLVFCVRMFDKKAHVAQKMGQAKLHEDVEVFHVLAVGREIVAAQDAVEFFAQHVHENIRATGRVDLEEREKRGLQDPRL